MSLLSVYRQIKELEIEQARLRNEICQRLALNIPFKYGNYRRAIGTLQQKVIDNYDQLYGVVINEFIAILLGKQWRELLELLSSQTDHTDSICER